MIDDGGKWWFYLAMRLTLIPLLFLIASCGPKYKLVQGKIEMVDFPQLSVVSTSNIGDTLLSKGKIETREGLYLNQPIMGEFSRPILKYKVGEYYLKTESDKHFQYYPVKVNLVTVDGGDAGHRIGFSENKKNGEITGWEISGAKLPLSKAPSVSRKRVTLIDEVFFKQELIYNGKSGNIALFLYREYSGNMARPAFSQELTYDLSASKIIGFKEVRLEVLRTTNTSIQYRVLNGFEGLN